MKLKLFIATLVITCAITLISTSSIADWKSAWFDDNIMLVSWSFNKQKSKQQLEFEKLQAEANKESKDSANELQKQLIKDRQWREMQQPIPDLNKVIEYNKQLRYY